MTLKDFFITSNVSLYFIYKYYKYNDLCISVQVKITKCVGL